MQRDNEMAGRVCHGDLYVTSRKHQTVEREERPEIERTESQERLKANAVL